MTTIIQADRDAAHKLLGGAAPEGLLTGEQDSLSLVQAFAAHRETAEARALAKAMQWPDQWPLGTRVRKRKGSSWQGRVVGYYSTDLTPCGYAVESEREPGSVQIYPKAAFEVIDPAQIVGAKP